MIYAIRYNAKLAKADRSDVLSIEDGRFIPSLFRSKYSNYSEVKLTATECLAEDWYLMKDGKEFIPNEWS